VLHGFAAGVVSTFAFTVIPVWRAAAVAPLRVLRSEVEQDDKRARRLIPLVGLTGGLIAVLILSIAETGSAPLGFGFTAAIGLALLLLAAFANVAIRLSRRAGRRIRNYHIRQGVANLHRPGNQTIGVVVSVGMGVLLLSTILIIQASLAATVAIEQEESLPNLFIIDIQEEQKQGVESVLADAAATQSEIAPMISARIRAVNGRRVDTSKVERDATRSTWNDRMRTREYFISYRDYLLRSEDVVEGTFWTGRPEGQEASIAENLAKNLGTELGATLTLDVQGIPIDATVTSLRRIRWQAMRPNAMIVLSPGEIEEAPKMFVASFRVQGETERYRVQKELVAAYPNLSVVDISEAAATVRLLLSRISAVFTVLGLLALFIGAVILGGSIAAGRFARERETMLLKVLGASRGGLRTILVSEYATLAIFGATLGWLLAELLNRVAVPILFQAPVHVPYGPVLSLLGGAVVLNVLVGLFVGRSVSNAAPLDVLREE